MRTDKATMGVANPYALAEVVIGRRVDWSRVANPHALIETALGMPWEKLINPASGSILFAGLTFGKGGPKRLPSTEAAADIERRLQAHRVFKPSTMPSRIPPSMQLLFNRSNEVALQQLRQAVELSLGAGSGSGMGEQWVDEGMFFTNPDEAEGGDPVQGGLGDCYYIAALDAVAWSVPEMIQWSPLVDPDHATQVQLDPTGPGSVRLSPGYYHSRDVGVPNDPVTTGPLWEYVTMTELLPESAKGVPLYATSSRAGETWPNLYEKAFAIWRTGSGDQPDFTPLGGGDCGEATRVLVGRDWNLDWWATESLEATDVLQNIQQHAPEGKTIHPMTAFTYGSADDFPQDGITRDYAGSNIIFNHCYSLLGFIIGGGDEYIVVRNPWGKDGTTRSDRAPDGAFGGLTLNTNGVFGLPVEVFREYFEGFYAVHP
jgi:hypothetical protein